MKFYEATDKVRSLKVQPSNDELLQIYSLYKQATDGDCNIPAPSAFNLLGKAKWVAWQSQKGISKSDAEKKYVSLVESLIKKYGLS
jgi:diazepam-binding inhibitor (GABA receptor modulating acyl-CoA-binding protein)